MTIEVGKRSGLIMPSASFQLASLSMKSDAGTVVAANAAGFWTAIDLSHTTQGYESVKLAAAANTSEQTILDITDVGVLTHVVAPGVGSAGIMTIRVTADGRLKTFISETLTTAGDRFCVGDFPMWLPTTGAGVSGGLGSDLDSGFDAAISTTVPAGTLITPIQALMNGLIGIPFKTTLKVTIQSSVNITATAQELNGCANYALFIPEGL